LGGGKQIRGNRFDEDELEEGKDWNLQARQLENLLVEMSTLV
jgi:hypothetical protein